MFYVAGGGRGAGHVLDIMHDHSRITIDSRIPTMPGRSTLGFHRPGRHCLHQARSAVGCWARRMKVDLRPTKNHFFRRVFLYMDDSVKLIDLFSGVATSRDRKRV